MNRRPDGAMHLDDVVPIEDFSNETMLALAERLETSSTFQECLTREVELDEIWRRVDTAIKAAREQATSAASLASLNRLFDLIWEAHDLAGEGKPMESARRLRQAMTLKPQES